MNGVGRGKGPYGRLQANVLVSLLQYVLQMSLMGDDFSICTIDAREYIGMG